MYKLFVNGRDLYFVQELLLKMIWRKHSHLDHSDCYFCSISISLSMVQSLSLSEFLFVAGLSLLICPKVSSSAHDNFNQMETSCSLKFDSYMGVCGSETFRRSSWIYLWSLGVGIGTFILSCLAVLLIILSWIFDCPGGMSGVNSLHILDYLVWG